MFRDETAKVLDKVSRPSSKPWGPGPTQHHGDTDSSECDSHRSGASGYTVAIAGDIRCPAILAEEASLRLSNHLSMINSEVLTQYLFDQVFMPETWLSLLPRLYAHTEGESALRWSIHAAGLFLMANQTGDHTALSQARKAYGRSLSLLSTRLGDHDEKLEDETLCTILLLHFLHVQDIAGERSSSSGSHLKACSSLLLQRYKHKPLAASNCKIANSLVIQSQAYVLKYPEHCSELYAEQICHCASAQPAAEILRQCLAIGKLRSTIADTHTFSSEFEFGAKARLLNIMHRAEEIDRALEEWEQSLTGRWLRKTAVYKLSSVLEINMDFYSNIQVGKVWNQYRCARILLHEVMIEILEQLGSTSSDFSHNMVSGIKRSAQVITIMLSAICDSIPFHLQQVDCNGEMVTQTSQRVLGGEHLLWPLDVVFHSPWSNENQRSQARKALQEIDTCLGLRQASKSLQLGNSSPTTPSSLSWANQSPKVLRSQIQFCTA